MKQKSAITQGDTTMIFKHKKHKDISEKRVVYFTNCETPYRTLFFNELSKECKLDVLYEFSKNQSRSKKWLDGTTNNHNSIFLDRLNCKNKISKYFKALKILLSGYDEIILGCYNSKSQMFCIFMLRLLRKKYILNFDGEIFLSNNDFKTLAKKFFIVGAKGYLIAGEESKKNLEKEVKVKNVYSYSFSSLTNEDLLKNEKQSKSAKRDKTVLVVGRYFDYKGLDIAVKAAKLDPSINWKIIGTAPRSKAFIKDQKTDEAANIEIVPFLQKEQLCEEYCKCGLLAMTSRQECWGLVINEAASFGMPIVSTKGCGAAVDFLSNSPYSTYLVECNNPEKLLKKVRQCLNEDNTEYSNYLLSKSKEYSIENLVTQHLNALR